MRKEEAVRCVPLELVHGLRKLAKRLWDEKNPVAVPLGALLEEFSDGISALEKLFETYEEGHAARLERARTEHAEKVAVLEAHIRDLKDRIAAGDAEHAGLHKKISELSDLLRRKEAELADARAAGAESESELNSRYVARMQELYDKLNKKEQWMLSSWKERSRELEICGREQEKAALENEKRLEAARKAIVVREQGLEDEFALKKAELIKTFERARVELQAREKSLAEREAALRDAGRK